MSALRIAAISRFATLMEAIFIANRLSEVTGIRVTKYQGDLYPSAMPLEQGISISYQLVIRNIYLKFRLGFGNRVMII